MPQTRRPRRTTRPDPYRRESLVRLGAILLSVGLLLLTAYLVWSHRGVS